MAQHDQVIDNAPGLAVRTDINAALAALFSSSSGVLQPTVRSPGQLWYDTSNTTTPTLWIRNAANTGWISLMRFSAADVGYATRTSPDRWVWNDKADLTGRDVMSLSDVGELDLGAILTLRETDNSARARIEAGIGSDPGTTTFTVHNAAGAVVGTLKQTSSGLEIYGNGLLRFYDNGGIQRGTVNTDVTGTDGKMVISARNNTGAIDCQATVDKEGIRVSVGNLNFQNAGIKRGQFGWDSSLGPFIMARDGSDAFLNYLIVTGFGIYVQGPNGKSQNVYGRNNSADSTRWVVGGNSDAGEPGLGFLICYDNTGVRKQRMEMDTAGLRLLDGASAGDVLTTGNFPSKSTLAAETNFPIGSTVLFSVVAGSEVARNAAVVMRLNGADLFSYKHTGAGALLAGTWVNSGTDAAAHLGLARRIS